MADLTLESFQRALDHFADAALDCCEVCGAPRPQLVYVGIQNGRDVYFGRMGGCEHHVATGR